MMDYSPRRHHHRLPEPIFYPRATAHAQRCPICYGEGKIRDKETLMYKTCHGCGGKGWVTVR